MSEGAPAGSIGDSSSSEEMSEQVDASPAEEVNLVQQQAEADARSALDRERPLSDDAPSQLNASADPILLRAQNAEPSPALMGFPGESARNDILPGVISQEKSNATTLERDPQSMIQPNENPLAQQPGEEKSLTVLQNLPFYPARR